MITASINVSKIDKARLVKGDSGTYLDIVLVETPQNKFGHDYMVCESVTKEERLAGKRGTILGNAKIVGTKAAAPQPGATPAPVAPPATADDVPF